MSSYTIKAEISERTGRKSYVARWDFIDGEGIRRHRKRSFKTKSAAQAHLLDVAKELKDRTYVEPSPEMTGEYLKRWAAELEGSERGESTVLQYTTVVEHRFNAIAGIPLSKLRRRHIDQMIKQWSISGLAPNTMNSAYRVLRMALLEAHRNELVVRNPSDGVKAPGKVGANRTVWSAGQIAEFLDTYRQHRDSMLHYLLFKTMMREGEAAALNWSDVDFDEKVIRIQRTLTKSKRGKWVIGETPKTDAGNRAFPLTDELIERLREHRMEQDARRALAGPAWIESGSVLDRGNGARMSCAVIWGRWRTVMAQQTIGPALTPHEARHSGVTLMVKAKVPIKVVSKLIGHADPAFTLRMYVHPLEDEHRSGAALLDRITQKRYDKRASGRIVVRQRAKKAPKSAA